MTATLTETIADRKWLSFYRQYYWDMKMMLLRVSLGIISLD